MTPSPKSLAPLGEEVKGGWHRFLDTFEPLRPELYRYCRHLTRSAWDAEDLVQDALVRAYVTLGTLFHELPNPRAWLFRVASNLWIDRVRRAGLVRTEVEMGTVEAVAADRTSADPRTVREAAGSLLVRLSPQERAAVVLKDVFGLSLAEIAETLGTTEGAVKAALHRGRGKVQAEEEPEGRAPAPEALAAFCEAFNAGDLDRMTGLLLDTAVVEIVGVVTEYGREPPKDSRTGSFAGTLAPLTYDDRGGVPPELLHGYVATSPTCEVRPHRDGWLLVFWYQHDTGPAVRTVMTAETDGASIARLRNYFFSPDVIAEVCRELALPYRVNGYRFWPGTP